MSDDVTADRSTARLRWMALAVGAIALVGCALGAPLSPKAFFVAYLAAWLFYLGIALGSMALLMAYHLTGGSWGFLIRRILEAGMRTLPLVAVLFLPIALGIKFLYPWADPSIVAASPKLQYQQFYLRPEWFWTRAAVYFALWLTIAFLLDRWSRAEDRGGNGWLAWKCRKLSAFGALVYGVSLHFAAIDWAMSLQPVFHSSIWGPLFAAGQLLSALCWAVIMLAFYIRRPPLAEVASREVRRDLASLLLTLLILWAYMAWFQFMLVWIANMPVDVVYYVPRATVFWKSVMWAIVALHFVVPMFLLLMRPIKRNSTAVAWIAALMLIMQLLHMYYQLVPGVAGGGLRKHWIDVLPPLGIGGLWLAYYLWQFGRRPLLPLHDFNREAAMRLREIDREHAEREESLAYG